MLKKLFNIRQSKITGWRPELRRRITARSVKMNQWLQAQTASILPEHRKIYSIAMVVCLAIATLWNICTLILKNQHV